MPKKREKKSTKKDSQLIIRINKEERDTFVDICDELDTSAAREIRLFIRRFLNEHDELVKQRQEQLAEAEAEAEAEEAENESEG